MEETHDAILLRLKIIATSKQTFGCFQEIERPSFAILNLFVLVCIVVSQTIMQTVGVSRQDNSIVITVNFAPGLDPL